MATYLLPTKTYLPPARSNLMSRLRLIEMLNASLAGKLTLLSAPAGFGKTTLVSEWAQCIQQPAAWLSLDSGDNDPIRFWRYMIASLQTVEATLGETARVALEAPQPPLLEPLVAALIHDLAALASPLVLVLDDYHLIEAESIHHSLNYLLDHLPPSLHLVITTRADPPLALPRRRARREMTEIRAADLCFTLQEAAQFLNTCMELNLSSEDVATLDSRTEGWIVGLHMAALSLQMLDASRKHDFVTSFAGDDRYVVDYLLEEIFQHLPPHIQTFLLNTSILAQLCGALGNTVTGRDDSQAILNYLEQANLFIVPLDNRRYWYRYHHLFADLLRQRLSQSYTAGHISQLYVRASRWCETEGLIAEAVDYALAADDTEYTVALIERHILGVFYRSEIALVYHWLKALPETVIRARPLLSAVYASTIAISEFPPAALDKAEQWLRQAESVLAAQAAASESAYNVATGFMAKFRAYLAGFRGAEPQLIINLCQHALASLPEKEWRFRSALAYRLGQAYWELGDDEAAIDALTAAKQVGLASDDLFNAAGAIHLHAELTRLAGKLRQAAAITEEGLRVLAGPASQRPIPYASRIYITLGNILYEWNNLEAADHALTNGLELSRLLTPPVQMIGYVALARLRAVQGNIVGAFDLLEQAERVCPAGSADEISPCRVRLWLAGVSENPHNLAQVTGWARQHHLDATQEQYSLEQLTLARVLITQHRLLPIEAKPNLSPVLTFLTCQTRAAQNRGWTGWLIETLILQALALAAAGDLSLAESALKRALALAEPEVYTRSFVDEGAPLAELLRQVKVAGAGLADYVKQLLAAFIQQENLRPPTPASGRGVSSTPSLVEPLSSRELEVLHLIAEGASNQEIAQTLFVALTTVKSHLTHIFRKLDVTSRTQAVAQARELGLLE